MCNKQFQLTGTEMLEKAKASTSDNSFTQIEVKRNSKIWRFIRAAAACLIISGLVFAYKEYTPFDDSKYSVEAPTRTIEHKQDKNIMEKITVQLVDVTFDASDLILVFDVTVYDEMLVANNDRIKLSAFILDNKSGENGYDCDAYGQKDDEVSNLYHVYMREQCKLMTDDQKFMTIVHNILFEKDDTNTPLNYSIYYKYDFEVPKEVSQSTYSQK